MTTSQFATENLLSAQKNSFRIMVVDDIAANRDLLCQVLRRSGHEPIEAADGHEAIRRAVEDRPDLILLDVSMPEMDGFEVCRTVKADKYNEHTPIIFVSARVDSLDKIKGLKLGAVDYITKPFHPGEMMAKVENQLKIKQLTESLIKTNLDLVRKQEQIDVDLKAAATIQQSLIPPRAPRIDGLTMAWRFMPCQQVGGDAFDITRIDEDHWLLYVLDVSGHGVPAAMVTVSVAQTLSAAHGKIVKCRAEEPPFYTISSPAAVLEKLDKEYPIDRFDKYFTISYMVLNIRNWQVRYSSAAHPMPVLVRANGSVEVLREGGTIIGIGAGLPFEEGSFELAPGDRLFLFTDGIVETFDSDDQCFGEQRLYEILRDTRHDDLEASCDQVTQSVADHGGDLGNQDDLTFVALQRDPATASREEADKELEGSSNHDEDRSASPQRAQGKDT